MGIPSSQKDLLWGNFQRHPVATHVQILSRCATLYQNLKQRKGDRVVLPPEHLIAMLGKKFPKLWHDIDECRAKHAESWPGWCFIRRDELADIMDVVSERPSVQ
jgi:hypothetical protein